MYSCNRREKLHKMHDCTKTPYFCESLRKSRSGPGKQYCSRSATGAESPHSEGEITYTELFCPTTADPIPAFSHKMSPTRRYDDVFGGKGGVISRKGCSNSALKPELDRNPNSEPRQDGGCWFLRYKKSFFFLFQISRGGGGAALSRPLCLHRRRWPQAALSPFHKQRVVRKSPTHNSFSFLFFLKLPYKCKKDSHIKFAMLWWIELLTFGISMQFDHINPFWKWRKHLYTVSAWRFIFLTLEK